VVHHAEDKMKFDSQFPQAEPVEQKKALRKEIERKFLDLGYDSDDVFANNPSTLMGAKVKVMRKFEEIELNSPKSKTKPQPPPPSPPPKDDKCPNCKKPKQIDTISQYETLQSKINPTISINSDHFVSPHYKRGKDSDTETSLEPKSIQERRNSVKEPKKVIRKRRKKKKKDTINRLSTPRQSMRQ